MVERHPAIRAGMVSLFLSSHENPSSLPPQQQKTPLRSDNASWSLEVDDEPVDVQFENAPETPCVRAKPVRFGRPHEVEIHFDRPCSPSILNAAIGGIGNERRGEGDAETPPQPLPCQ